MARFVLAAALAVSACGGAEGEPNPYPGSAKIAFHRECPAGEPVCDCTWDKITRTLTYEEYSAAMRESLRTGLMDARMARASAECKEQHAG